MSTTRRKFLKAGMFAAMFAAVPLSKVAGKSWKDRDGNFDEDDQTDPLSTYTKSTFTSHLNSVFQLQTASGVVEVTLLEVADLPGSSGGESFSLLFRGGSQQLKQDTYQMCHPSLCTCALFVVPTDADANGAQGYLATLNRISYSNSLNYPPPTRGNSHP